MVRKWLRDLRLKRGLPQQFVASQLGLSFQQYSFLECGTRMVNMPLPIADGLSKVFKISLEKISENEEEWRNDANKTRVSND